MTPERNLASAVLVQLLFDLEVYEKSAGKNWRGDSQRSIGRRIYRDACDALACTFLPNKTMTMWCEACEIPINVLRAYIRMAYPKTCEISITTL